MFTHGSLIRHVVVMTSTGAVGLMAIFAVDLLSLFWVSRLGDQAFKAAVGYVGLAGFFAMSINIGLTIAASATVSHAIGAGDRTRGRRLAASSLAIAAAVSIAASVAMFVLRDWALTHVVHASGEPFAVASKFLAITIPANVPLALGVVMSGLLRAVGDARRAMYVTLSGAVVTAILDPALIYGLGLGVYGAAWATVASRLCFLVVGFHGSVMVHDVVARPNLRAARRDFGPIMAIGLPAILANMATPVGSAYTVRVFSDIGEAAIASGAIIDRVTPFAFAIIFALTGSVGPIIGQNYGARLMGRVQRTLSDAFLLSIGYVLFAWTALALAAPWIVAAFDASGESAGYVTFYCRYGVVAWLFLACLFVANTAFNNLGFPVLSMVFNWGRATLGTIPFVTFGVRYGGVKGGLVGIALGSALFGVVAVATAYGTTARLARRLQPDRAAGAEGRSHDAQRHSPQRARRPGGREPRRAVRPDRRSGRGGDAGDDPGLFRGASAAQERSRGARRAGRRTADGRHGASFADPGAARDLRARTRRRRRSGRPRRSVRSPGAWLRRPASRPRRSRPCCRRSPRSCSAASPTRWRARGTAARSATSPARRPRPAASARRSAPPAARAAPHGDVGAIFGGAHEPANPQTAALVAGLAALGGMFAAGVVASQAAQQASLGAMASSFTQPPTT